MASTASVILTIILMLTFWFLIGVPLTTRTLPKAIAYYFAPVAGWAFWSALSLAVLSNTKMSYGSVLALGLLCIAVSLAFLIRDLEPLARPPLLLVAAIIGAAALASVPAHTLMPHEMSDGFALASAISDHSKVALIDEMMRSGLPPVNPFFSQAGIPDKVSYYYLWHFSAASIGLLSGASGWEADVALTWFTAFTSLLMMIGLALWFSGNALSAPLTLVIAATGSFRPILHWLVGSKIEDALLRWPTGFGGWFFQEFWAPQHVASTLAVILAYCLIIGTAFDQKTNWLKMILLGVAAAAGFESSVWVGGIVFPIASVLLGIILLIRIEASRRVVFCTQVAIAALIAIVLVSPLLRDQLSMTAFRENTWPVVLQPVEVLGDGFSPTFQKWADPIAYWTIYLPFEFPAFYGTAIVSIYSIWKRNRAPDAARFFLFPFVGLLAVSLATGGLLASVIGDGNDLSWRAVLPAIIMMIPLAAAGISEWMKRSRFAAALPFAAIALGLIGTANVMAFNTAIASDEPAKEFKKSAAMWKAVRAHASPSDRIASNPYFLQKLTKFSVNISWALLSNRRSCYASHALAVAFAPISAKQRDDLDDRFTRLFEEIALPGDVEAAAKINLCDVVVIARQDGAWARDPFAASSLYRLVEEKKDGWRIYRLAEKRDQ